MPRHAAPVYDVGANPRDMCKTPWNAMKTWEVACRKEEVTAARLLTMRAAKDPRLAAMLQAGALPERLSRPGSRSQYEMPFVGQKRPSTTSPGLPRLNNSAVASSPANVGHAKAISRCFTAPTGSYVGMDVCYTGVWQVGLPGKRVHGWAGH
eukprot:TRINITY_DN76553_c0_g1_i1.p2 TRINITY_DN76553_c0_g1~~TRINITY_DN76553_c0_g1_i1.p2  ORF type:complete len:163 (+),score=25.04 TRINITY_DN76553_c0_g1_i1:35-490(+)